MKDVWVPKPGLLNVSFTKYSFTTSILNKYKPTENINIPVMGNPLGLGEDAMCSETTRCIKYIYIYIPVQLPDHFNFEDTESSRYGVQLDCSLTYRIDDNVLSWVVPHVPILNDGHDVLPYLGCTIR